MKKKCLVSLFAALLLLSFNSWAQLDKNVPPPPDKQEHHTPVKKDTKYNYGLEAKKIAFFSDELELTPKEAQQFWPLYNELWDKRIENRKIIKSIIRQLDEERKKENPDKALIKKLSEQYLEKLPEDSEIFTKYLEKFKSFMPIEKVARVPYVEEKFRESLIRQLKEKKKEGPEPPMPKKK